MISVLISRFKATCLAAQERVRNMVCQLWVTSLGRPVADISPAETTDDERSWTGAFASTNVFVGDLVTPLAVAWDAAKQGHEGAGAYVELKKALGRELKI
jgi:hypothetical protein